MAKKKFYRPILYGALLTLKAVFFILPFQLTKAFAGWLGSLTFDLLPKEQKKVLEHLRIAFPDKTEAELKRIGKENFRNYGHTLAELAMLEKLMPKFHKIIRVEGKEYFDEALAQKKGIVAVSAHFGNWEILAGALSLMGYPGSVVAKRIYYEPYNRLLVGVRNKMGLQTIYRDESARDVVRALKENRVLGILADQDVEEVDGVFVNFFGKNAYTPSAPVKLAMKFDAPLILCFVIREKGLNHRIFIEKPIELQKSGDEAADVVANTQKWVSIQEAYIRRYPHLWVWNHKRWKTVKKDKVD